MLIEIYNREEFIKSYKTNNFDNHSLEQTATGFIFDFHYNETLTSIRVYDNTDKLVGLLKKTMTLKGDNQLLIPFVEV